MGIPASPHARLFYRLAFRRFDEAGILLKADQETGAVYLAGYAVECVLKALVLNSLPADRQQTMLEFFRGNRAHDFEWLRRQYLENRGTRFPVDVTRCFTMVGDWSTELRYRARDTDPAEAAAFLDAVGKIIRWADERL